MSPLSPLASNSAVERLHFRPTDCYFRLRQQGSSMAGNYVIVADFCDRAGPFLKVEKNSHSRQKIVCSVRFCPKTVGFRFKNCHSTTPTTCQLHVAKNSFMLTTYVSPFRANTSANLIAVSCQIWRGCQSSADSGDLSQAPPKQSAVCSTCIIPALPVNCQFIWMACAFGMSATQPILG